MRASTLLVLGALVASLIWAVWMNRIITEFAAPLLNVM